MQPFQFSKVKSNEEALSAFREKAKFLGGGTTLIDLMKLEVETPTAVVDVNGLPLSKIEKLANGGAKVGAGVKNTDFAQDPHIQKNFPVLSQAILSGASVQLRNKATTAGNLLQRTRCVYFRDPSKACNKRDPGSGCSAIEGFNRNLAIMGVSNKCIASNPSDMNVALTALEATVQIQSKSGTRDVAIGDFFLLPGDTPEKETVVAPGDLITGVTLNPLPNGAKSLYLKLRDRASYEFATSSAAVIVVMKAGKFDYVRFAMGGIGTKPWRNAEVEKMLIGQEPTEANLKAAAEAFLKGAKPASENKFKVELAKRCLTYALKQTTRA